MRETKSRAPVVPRSKPTITFSANKRTYHTQSNLTTTSPIISDGTAHCASTFKIRNVRSWKCYRFKFDYSSCTGAPTLTKTFGYMTFLPFGFLGIVFAVPLALFVLVVRCLSSFGLWCLGRHAMEGERMRVF